MSDSALTKKLHAVYMYVSNMATISGFCRLWDGRRYNKSKADSSTKTKVLELL